MTKVYKWFLKTLYTGCSSNAVSNTPLEKILTYIDETKLFTAKISLWKNTKNILVAVNIKSVPKTGHKFEPQLFKNKKMGRVGRVYNVEALMNPSFCSLILYSPVSK